MIQLDQIREDPDIQLRPGLSEDRIVAMMEFIREGGSLPPVTVVGEANLLADGHHRLACAARMGALEILANREPGGKDMAVAISIRDNDSKSHLPLDAKGRNAGIAILLNAGWSATKVSKITGLSDVQVRRMSNFQEAVKKQPDLHPHVAIEIERIGQEPHRGTAKRLEVRPEIRALRDEVAAEVKKADLQVLPTRQVRKLVQSALDNDIVPDVKAIVASVAPVPVVDTPYGAVQEVLARFRSFDRPIKFNGQEVSIDEVMATVLANPGAEELAPYAIANEPVAAYLVAELRTHVTRFEQVLNTDTLKELT